MSDNGREEETRERAASEDDNRREERSRVAADDEANRAAAPSEKEAEPQTTSLILRDLAPRVRVQDVRELFEKHGAVKDGKNKRYSHHHSSFAFALHFLFSCSYIYFISLIYMPLPLVIL